MHSQIPLNIQLPEAATFDSFVAGENQLVKDVLKKVVENSGELQVYIWSDKGLGKTHLLQASCHSAADLNKSVCYIPLEKFVKQSTDILQGLEDLDLVCLDDLQVIAGHKPWEQALFSLINESRASQTHLILAGSGNTHELGLQLPDLHSRLTWGPVFQLKSLTDDAKLEVLQLRA